MVKKYDQGEAIQAFLEILGPPFDGVEVQALEVHFLRGPRDFHFGECRLPRRELLLQVRAGAKVTLGKFRQLFQEGGFRIKVQVAEITARDDFSLIRMVLQDEP